MSKSIVAYRFHILPHPEDLTPEAALQWLQDRAAGFLGLATNALHMSTADSLSHERNAFGILACDVATMVSACGSALAEREPVRLGWMAEPGSAGYPDDLRNLLTVVTRWPAVGEEVVGVDDTERWPAYLELCAELERRMPLPERAKPEAA